MDYRAKIEKDSAAQSIHVPGLDSNKAVSDEDSVRQIIHAPAHGMNLYSATTHESCSAAVGIDPDRNDIGSPDRLTTKERLFKVFRAFSESTSLHGFGLITSARSSIKKMFWIFVVTSFLSVLFYQSGLTIQQFMLKGTVTNVKRILNDKLNLPDMMICNKNIIRLSKLKLLPNKIQDLILKPAELKEPSPCKKDSYTSSMKSITCEKRPHENLNVREKINFVENQIALEFGSLDRSVQKKVSHQFKNMIIWCSFDGDTCPFIPLQKKFYKGQICHELDLTAFKIKSAGIGSGLELAFFVESDEYIKNITITEGLELYFQGKKSPRPYSKVFLTPGYQTSVALETEHVQKLGKPYGDCFDDFESYLERFGLNYHQELCQDICWLQNFMRKCQCFPRQYNTFKLNESMFNTSLCDRQNECGTVTDIVTEEACHCPYPCKNLNNDIIWMLSSEVTYKPTVSTMKWPNHHMAIKITDSLCRRENFRHKRCSFLKSQNEKELRKNFVLVNVYHHSMLTTQFIEVPEESVATLFNKIGGYAGLLFGFSCVSLIEIIYLFGQVISRILNLTGTFD